jgi:EAL domain-containing protein (putative c-di-GMP-specific phosphodiesterase class I)
MRRSRFFRPCVRLSIDDFGTGYSSLLYLRRYDADYLKIDRSFVAGLGMNPQDDAIVKTTIELAHVFGMAVVAEGVETQQQAYGLRTRGCDFAQGYLWSRPVPPLDFPWQPVRDSTSGSSSGTGEQRP